MSSERPRRSHRLPEKLREKPAAPAEAPQASSSTAKKRKASAIKDSDNDPITLDFMLTNSKSPLVNLELSVCSINRLTSPASFRILNSQTLINEHTWSALSEDSRSLLSTMLPPTALPFFRPGLDPRHPATTQLVSQEAENDSIDINSMALACEPDLSFFTDPFFEADSKTFQVCRSVGGLPPNLFQDLLLPFHQGPFNFRVV